MFFFYLHAVIKRSWGLAARVRVWCYVVWCELWEWRLIVGGAILVVERGVGVCKVRWLNSGVGC